MTMIKRTVLALIAMMALVVPATAQTTNVAAGPPITHPLTAAARPGVYSFDGWWGGAQNLVGSKCGGYDEKCMGGLSVKFSSQQGSAITVATYLQQGTGAYKHYEKGERLVNEKKAQEFGSGTTLAMTSSSTFTFSHNVALSWMVIKYENCSFSDSNNFTCTLRRSEDNFTNQISFRRLP